MRLILFLILNFSQTLIAQDSDSYYNEIYDEKGEVREHYKKVYAIFERMSQAERKKFDKQSLKDFSNDNALFPLPRLLLESEVAEIREGVDQRARALTQFLQDYYSEKHSYRKAGIFPDGVLEKIVKRYGEDYFLGKVNPKSISFIYGPDIIRGPDAKFYVIEDNPGYVGGLGDLVKAREVILKRAPEYKNVLEQIDSPEVFYDQLVAKFRSHRGKNCPVVLLTLSRSDTADNEDVRLKKLLSDRGVEVVSPRSGNQIIMKNGEAYLEKRIGDKITRRKIGYLVLNAEPGHIAYDLPPYQLKALKSNLEEHRLVLKESLKNRENVAPDYKKWCENLATLNRSQKISMIQRIEGVLAADHSQGEIIAEADELNAQLEKLNDFGYKKTINAFPKGLMQLVMSGKLPSSYSPGVDFIGDKEFYVYVDKLIEFYLKEKPIISNIPTKVISEHPEMIAEFLKNPEKYVVKSKDGRGGDAVFIGPKMTKSAIQKLVASMRSHGDQYIIQDIKNLSRIAGMITDARLVSHVDVIKNIIPYTPWGRALPVDGDGKVNLSANGKEIAIIPVPDPQMNECHKNQGKLYRRGASF